MLLDATTASLLVIDVQDRLLPAMRGAEQVEKHCGILLKVARALDVPVTVSEQYPRGLGHTVPALKEDAGNAPVFEKLNFSCWRDPALKTHMVGHHEAGRPQVIAAGIEVITTEMAVFELLGRAGTSEFKTLSALIR